jgi:uncharacterized protein (TIGR02145 family)
MKTIYTSFLFAVVFSLSQASFAQPYSLTGTIRYGNASQTLLEGVKIILKLSGSPVDSTYTNVSGTYSLSGLQNGVYTISFHYPQSWSGVNGTDALKIERHFSGLELFSDQVVLQAADVNNSGSINGTDALKVKRRFASLDNSFQRGDWTFSKTSSGNDSITVDGSNIIQDFYGLCVGDVNGSYTPSSFSCGQSLTDTRNGKAYNTVLIGTQCWMKENLNLGTWINAAQNQTNNGVIEKHCYSDLESNCDVYGALYQWAEIVQYLNGATNTASWNPVPTGNIQGLCPQGWHLSSNPEWSQLMAVLGGQDTGGGPMKETGTQHWIYPNAGATNSSGFTSLPGGRWSNNGVCNGLNTFAYFWTSTEYSADNSYGVGNVFMDASIGRFYITKASSMSVRCILD